MDSKHALTVLNRLAARSPEHVLRIEEALRGRLEDLASVVLDVAVETGDPIGRALALQIEEETSLSVVAQLVESCDQPGYRASVPLLEVSLVATEKLLEFLRSSSMDEEQQQRLADLGDSRSIRLNRLGQLEAALGACQETLRFRRRQYLDRPEVAWPPLANGLTRLSTILMGLGRREEALAAARESVVLYRENESPAQQDPLLPGFAHSLAELAEVLCDLGFREEAILVGREVVDRCRQLLIEPSRKRLYRSALAGSLLTLGRAHAESWHFLQAAQLIEEAVELFRDLAEQRPDIFVHRLASALHNLGALYSDQRRWEKARKATQEAVDLRRKLASLRPDTFLGDLSSSLNNLGNHWADLGKPREALLTTREAAILRRELARNWPRSFSPDLANSLTNLGTIHRAMGHAEEAVCSSEAALRIVQPFFLEHPEAFGSSLFSAIGNYLTAAEAAWIEPNFELLLPLRGPLEDLRREALEKFQLGRPFDSGPYRRTQECSLCLEWIDLAQKKLTGARFARLKRKTIDELLDLVLAEHARPDRGPG